MASHDNIVTSAQDAGNCNGHLGETMITRSITCARLLAGVITPAVLLSLNGCSSPEPAKEPPSPTAETRVTVPMQFSKAPPKPPAPSFPVISRDFTESEKNIVEEAVKVKLKDPSSAQFKWPKYHNNIEDYYCGYVNAKNSYGGYNGFARYIALFIQNGTNEKPSAALLDMDDGTNDAIIKTLCANAGY